jgi:NAD(P)-dependent dehydrogenase (short-subunit alcohol dehydrogenase family)
MPLPIAVRHMASSLGVEWAKKGVRVNTLRFVFLFTSPDYADRRNEVPVIC